MLCSQQLPQLEIDRSSVRKGGAAMARNDALKKLQTTLSTRRDELRRRIGGQLDNLAGSDASVVTGDSADVAFESVGEELSSQLAEMEARELAQIQVALQRIKTGHYGICDGCTCKIPVARLTALPYSTMCVKCQEEAENDETFRVDRGVANWDALHDTNDREITASQLESDL
jgi:DnaK suppressor protein